MLRIIDEEVSRMLSVSELSRQISRYRDGEISIGDFEEWFEDATPASAYENPALRPACVAVDSALAQYHFDHIGEDVLKMELATAVPRFYEAAAGACYRQFGDGNKGVILHYHSGNQSPAHPWGTVGGAKRKHDRGRADSAAHGNGKRIIASRSQACLDDVPIIVIGDLAISSPSR
jgi:hypothetical protein